ncbi:MAG: phosphate ABC transporter substrate-binding protein [Dokdonella sp.]
MNRARRVPTMLAALLGLVAVSQALASTHELSGTLTSAGSDSLGALLWRWSEAFGSAHPSVRFQMQALGSATAPAALLEGATDFGVMSRVMSSHEEQAFTDRYGYPPTRIKVALDAIVIFVNPDNPLTQIRIDQLDAIYSVTRRCGADRPIGFWNALSDSGGSTERSGHHAILAIGRNAASGTHEHFRIDALCNGRFRDDVVEWPGNGAVVDAVAENPDAIGYAAMAFVNGRVRTLALAATARQTANAVPDSASIEQPVSATPETVRSGQYPLARAMYVYLNHAPQRKVAELPRAFIEFILSSEGQTIVAHEGFIPLAASDLSTERARVQ